MEQLSTIGLPVKGRAAAWGQLYATRMSLCEFIPEASAFDAHLRIGEIGPVKLARLSVDRCEIERDRQHIAGSSARMYNFLLQAKGSSTFHHCGNEAMLVEGDFVLVDTNIPHHFSTPDHSETIMVRVRPDVLKEYLPTPEQFLGRRLAQPVGITGMVGEMVRKLTETDHACFGAAYESRIARHLLEMVSMSYTMGFGESSRGSALSWQRRNDILRYVEDRLRDPNLTPAGIAEGLRISPRYLRTIFAVSGEKLSMYILRRRLEECARQLANPAWHGHTLTEIAFSWGFNSAAYFARSFRDKYNMSPREYRRAGLQ